MIFKNRREAGKLLGEKLLKYKHNKIEKTVVIGLLRGGIPVAYEIAKALNAPLDVALVRKIGAPNQEELAIGAIVDGKNPKVYLNKPLISQINISKDYIDRVKEIKLEEIRKREKIYRKGRERIDVHGKIAIVVDDGIATGASIRVVIEALKEEKPKKIIIAVPVIPVNTLSEFKKMVDDIIVLDAPEEFYAVGEFYENFSQTTDEEVILLLQKSKA